VPFQCVTNGRHARRFKALSLGDHRPSPLRGLSALGRRPTPGSASLHPGLSTSGPFGANNFSPVRGKELHVPSGPSASQPSRHAFRVDQSTTSFPHARLGGTSPGGAHHRDEKPHS
jgi:hypothetical protein